MNPQFFKAYKFSLILFAGNLLLALIFFAEWQFHSGYEERLKTMLQQKHHSSNLFASLPEYTPTLSAENDYHKIIDQPLFIEGRQPVENTGDTQRNLAQNPVMQASKPNVRLTGIVLLPDILVALLQDNMGKNFRVKQGESIQGWDVDSIQNDKITITNGVDRQDVLLREPKPTKVHPPGVAVPPPGSVPPGMTEVTPPAPPPLLEFEDSGVESEPEIEPTELESEDQ